MNKRSQWTLVQGRDAVERWSGTAQTKGVVELFEPLAVLDGLARQDPPQICKILLIALIKHGKIARLAQVNRKREKGIRVPTVSL